MAKTYTSVPTVSTNQTYPSATYNTYTAQNINNLIVPPSVSVYNSANTNITSGVAIPWNSELHDTDDMHSTSSNTDRITINTAGLYIFSFLAWVTFSGTSTASEIYVSKNGVLALGSPINLVIQSSTTSARVLNASGVAPAVAGDYFSAVWVETGGTSPQIQSARSYFSATWIGRTS